MFAVKSRTLSTSLSPIKKTKAEPNIANNKTKWWRPIPNLSITNKQEKREKAHPFPLALMGVQALVMGYIKWTLLLGPTW